MGWDISRFVDQNEIDNELLCAICQGVLENPMQTKCEHTFCHDCITKWLSASADGNANKTCPSDRRPLKASQLTKAPRVIRSFINRLIIRCKYYERGCAFIIRFENLPGLTEHENIECQLRKMEIIEAEKKDWERKAIQSQLQLVAEEKEKNRFKELYTASQLDVADLKKTCASLKRELQNKENHETEKARKIARLLGEKVREQEETTMKNLSQLKEQEETTMKNLSQLKEMRSKLETLEEVDRTLVRDNEHEEITIEGEHEEITIEETVEQIDTVLGSGICPVCLKKNSTHNKEL